MRIAGEDAAGVDIEDELVAPVHAEQPPGGGHILAGNGHHGTQLHRIVAGQAEQFAAEAQALVLRESAYLLREEHTGPGHVAAAAALLAAVEELQPELRQGQAARLVAVHLGESQGHLHGIPGICPQAHGTDYHLRAGPPHVEGLEQPLVLGRHQCGGDLALVPAHFPEVADHLHLVATADQEGLARHCHLGDVEPGIREERDVLDHLLAPSLQHQLAAVGVGVGGGGCNGLEILRRRALLRFINDFAND